jgi:acetyl-CoA acyltransferase
VTVNRFCSSGLQAIAYAAERIIAGGASVIVAGGTESMSMVPMGGNKIAPNPALVDTYPDVYLTTGLVAENHVREFNISRGDQDAFALRSHQRAVAAIDAGRFADEIVPLAGLTVDEGPRRDTSMDALAKLRPAFHAKGSVTAGNSSQMSDGASAVIVMDGSRVRELGIEPLGRFVAFATAGVAPERFGIGPVPAVAKVLKQTGLSLDRIDLVELNEAFAAQALACLRELPIDPDRLNVNGGAIALGHPLGCSGAKLTTTLLHEMKRRHSRYGLVTMCVGGGMGAAGIFERV